MSKGEQKRALSLSKPGLPKFFTSCALECSKAYLTMISLGAITQTEMLRPLRHCAVVSYFSTSQLVGSHLISHWGRLNSNNLIANSLELKTKQNTIPFNVSKYSDAFSKIAGDKLKQVEVA